MSTPAPLPAAKPKHRYELKETTGEHPWRKRRNPLTRELEPAFYWMRGVWDNERKDWHAQPRSKDAGQFADVRLLNGLLPLNVQQVRGVLRKARIQFSTSETTRVRGWHHVTSGVTVWQSEDGSISVGYVFNHWAKEHHVKELLTPALNVLQAAGLNPTQHDDGRIEL